MSISLIMCSWNRPWYIEPVLKSVESQTLRPDEFIIWNNNLKLKNKLDEIVGDRAIIHHHDKNIGGFGRFYAARSMAKSDYVVFIDDDWELKPDHIEHLNNMKKPKSIVGLWAWRYNKNADRSRVINGPAHYIGTCGQISPREIYDSKGLYKCPDKYWFLEDIWLSYYARYELGVQLLACGELEKYARNMNRNEKGQLIEKVPGLSAKMWNTKPKFVKYLMDRYK